MEIKEKKVELIELFYDLIYVYAISRLTLIIENPQMSVDRFFSYLVICFVILQAWLYLTNYVNRYGEWKWYEYVLTSINMIATLYMSNTISANWVDMALTFNIAMLIMLLCVGGMYLIQVIKKKNTRAAKNSLTILTIDYILYFLAFLASLFHFSNLVIWLDGGAVLAGAFLPFFIRGHFDASIISFPHLAERFELITIITFGEGIVGITDFFNVNHFSIKPILVFMIVLSLFGCYVVQIHLLCNHHRIDRALRLMFSHYFIVIAINLITVSFKYIELHANKLMIISIMFLSTLLFFVSIFANRVYYHQKYELKTSDYIETGILFLIGGLIMLIFRTSDYGLLMGILFITGLSFIQLVKKYDGGTLS